MNDLELILHLRELGVKFWLEGESVRFQAPRGALTPELRAQMKERKEMIRDLLRREHQGGRLEAASAVLSPITPAPRDQPLPLSYAQQRLWLLWHMEPNNTSYNMPAALRLSGALDEAALARSLEELIARHEILRTTFRAHTAGPQQIIHGHMPLELPIRDVRHLAAAEREAAMRAEAAREMRSPFDLARGPLLRARLLRLDDREHVLLFTIHHIVADAWSMSVLVRELTALYQAFCQGTPSPLPPVPLHYADYAVWQRSWLEGGEMERGLAFWKDKLADAPRLLELPTDRPRSQLTSSAGAQVTIEVPREDLASLHALSHRQGATLYMTLLAVFEVLLARYTGQEDIVVGTPVASRSRAETETMLGFFINLLVLRVHLSSHQRFVDLLDHVKETTLEAQTHQQVPFERLVQELAIERAHGRTPLVQVVFNFDNTPKAVLELPGLRVAPIELASENSKMDLSLEMSARGERLVGTLYYSTELFERSTAERMARHFRNLVRAVAKNPDQRIAELAMLDGDERAAIITTCNDTDAERPAGATVHGLVAAQAQRTPDALAVWSDHGALTYAELVARASRCARALRGLGVGAEQPVAVCMERSLARVAWVLGILEAGAVYLPLPTQGPPERVRTLLEDARPAAVVADPELVSLVEGTPAALLDGLATPDQTADASPGSPEAPEAVDPEQLAYIIYTSGSTGRPKGVQVPHRALCNHLLHRQHAYPLQVGDRFMHKASSIFDIAIWEMFAPLIAGATVLLARPGGQRDCSYLAQLAAAQGATYMHFPPFLLELFLDEPPCPSLRRVFCGGEPMSGALAARFYERYPDAELVHQYGPTEATVDVTMGRAAPGPAELRVPIGTPIANTRVYVLDEHLEIVPVGPIGELCIGGHGVARGYLNEPALTATRFVPDPFADEPGMRLYRTGDRVRWRADGALEFVGRADHQVKLRGYRVELGEIEAALRRHSAVRDAVVVVRGDAGEATRLVAYVVPHSGAAPGEADLRAFLRCHLPDHMVPASVLALDAFPLTRTGKIDRRALPDAGQRVREDDDRYAAPRTDLEQALCALFAEVLHIDRIGIHDDFFASGGDSLVATRLVAKIDAHLGVSFDLSLFFEAPTVAEVAAHLDDADGAPREAPIIVPIRANSGAATPLFCIHPAGGQVFAYQPLAALLAPTIAVYGVQSCAVGDPSLELVSAQEMAAMYASAIQEVQPSGPYHLLGWSMGGVLAVGVTHELEKRGQRVALIGLVDAYPGEFLAAGADDDPVRGLALALGGALGAAYGALADADKARLRAELTALPPAQRLARVLDEARARGVLGADMPLEHLEDQVLLIDTHRQLLDGYRPPVVDAPVDVWWAGDAGDRPDWAAHTRSAVRVEHLPGDHFSILREPRCHALARDVSERLARARAGDAPAAERAGAR